MHDRLMTALTEICDRKERTVDITETGRVGPLALVKRVFGAESQTSSGSRERESNPRPSLYKSAALTI